MDNAAAEPAGFTTLLFLVALLVTIAFLLLRSHRYFSRQGRSGAPRVSQHWPKTQKQKPAHHLGASDEMVQWEVEMHDVARDLTGQLDSKMGTLGQLIREADRAAARLEAALAAAQERTGAVPAVAETRPPSPEPAPPSPQGISPRNQAEALKAAGAGDPAAVRPSGRAPGTGDPPRADRRYEEIYLLADYGYDAAEIAHRVGTPVGEIQLILGLRAKR